MSEGLPQAPIASRTAQGSEGPEEVLLKFLLLVAFVQRAAFLQRACVGQDHQNGSLPRFVINFIKLRGETDLLPSPGMDSAAARMPEFTQSRHHRLLLRGIAQNGFRVTVGDVASTTGLAVWQVEQALLALAVEVGGHLQVAPDGEMAYVFPRNLRAILLSRRWWGRLQDLVAMAGQLLFYLLRISFGIVLIGLIGAVLLALALVMTVLASSDTNGDGSSLWDGSLVEGLFRWDLHRGGLDPQPFPRRPEAGRHQQNSPDRSELNFLEAIFSFLFGDGNPNGDVEERRWQAIGSLIRQQRGVLLAEQLTPFLDHLKGDPEMEAYVLPALVRFHGQPHVSPEGELVYAFPELQVSTSEPKELEPKGDLSYLREHPWRFSRASSAQRTTAFALGLILLVLSLVLRSLLSAPVLAAVAWPALLMGVATAGMIYSAAYLLLPLLRYLWLKSCNSGIEKRNAMRRNRAENMSKPSSTIARKLAYAQQLAGFRTVAPAGLLYTSEKDWITQQLDNADKDGMDWQRRLHRKTPFKF